MQITANVAGEAKQKGTSAIEGSKDIDESISIRSPVFGKKVCPENMDSPSRAISPRSARMSNRVVIIGNLLLSVVIVGFLIWLIYAFELDAENAPKLAWLPGFNASCNAISAICVAVGIVFIKQGDKQFHITSMILATAASACFLAGYLVHHTVHGDTRFLTTGWIRPVYFALLITHILAATVALPLILNTLSFAILRRFDAHKTIARWTYPIWMYVSVTGVMVWFFLRHLNQG